MSVRRIRFPCPVDGSDSWPGEMNLVPQVSWARSRAWLIRLRCWLSYLARALRKLRVVPRCSPGRPGTDVYSWESICAAGGPAAQGEVPRALQPLGCVLALVSVSESPEPPVGPIAARVECSSGQLHRASYQARGVRRRQRFSSYWANPSHWPARGPCGATCRVQGRGRAGGDHGPRAVD